ncbi:MAG TPA: phage major capsid protein [Solirubrobacteraceae bacterium]
MNKRVELRQQRERRADLLEKMDKLHRKASDRPEGQRSFHPDEQKRWDEADAEVYRVDAQIAALEAELRAGDPDPAATEMRARILGGEEGRSGAGERDDDARGGGLGDRRPLLSRDQRIADRIGGGARDINLGGALRGMITGNWDGAEAEQRALASTTIGAGGALVPTPLAAFVIDRARQSARVMEAGAQSVLMESETLKIPRLLEDPQGAWRNQNELVAEDDAVFDQVELKAKTLAVLIRIPWELGQDMTPEAAAIIESALIRSLALELDRAALRGTGEQVETVVGPNTIVGEEPRGVLNQDGVTVQSLGVNGASLDAGRYGVLLNGVGAVWARNHQPNAQIYSTRTALAIGGWTATDGQPLQPPPALADVKQLPTNQIPNDLEHGTSDDTSEIYTGDWSQMLIGFRPQLGIAVVKLDQTFATRMQTGLLAYLRADVALAHAGAFAVTTGVRP